MGAALTPKSLRPNRDDDRTSMRLPGQRRAYPDIVPLTVGLAPDTAFNRALDTAGRRGWTIVAADEAAARQRRLIPSQRDSIGHMMRAQLPHRTQDFRNMARQRYCRRLARIGKPCASADRVAKPAAHTRAGSRGSRPSNADAAERLTLCWREQDSNPRSLRLLSAQVPAGMTPACGEIGRSSLVFAG